MDILKFLMIVAVIAIFIIKEARKNKAKPSGTPPPIPVPKPTTASNTPPAVPKQTVSMGMAKLKTQRNSAASKAPEKSNPFTNADTTKPETETDIAIRSAEDARRAVIWSEILNRKY